MSSLKEVESEGRKLFDDPIGVVKGGAFLGAGLIAVGGPALAIWRLGGRPAVNTTENVVRGVHRLGRDTLETGADESGAGYLGEI